MAWSLYTRGKKGDEFLPPLKFSNGKTQQDVVDEISNAIAGGDKIIFLRGVCGTGKSAIALNLAKKLGKACIVVPVKALQKQYEDDYTDRMYLLKDNGQKLNIKLITGRTNFSCPFLNESPCINSPEKKEKNALLDDFQQNSPEKILKLETPSDSSCDCSFLPCKIEIKEKNAERIKKYLKENSRVDTNYFDSLSKVKRMSIAPVCPYWSPIVPSEIDLGAIEEESSISRYLGLQNTHYSIYKRKGGCGYYSQYMAYIDGDAIIFNSQKYKLETIMNRKPATEVEIIDECDEFLDNFSNEEKINLNRLNIALGGLFAEHKSAQKLIDELIQLSSEMIKDRKIELMALKEEIFPIKETKIYGLLKKFIDNDLMGSVECDEENYCYHAEEVARIFERSFDETYVSFYKEEKNLFVKLVTINLEKRFKELIEKNKALVLMSGTIHSEKVLSEIFGIKNYKTIDAEVKMPGKITPLQTGFEMDCKYSNFSSGKCTREAYLLALEKCLEKAKKPALIHVNSFSDLPSKKEVEEYHLDIIPREEFSKLQKEDKTGEIVSRFKSGEIDTLYTTKCNRGIDFPGEVCNSIILTKYPYPNISSLFWRILRKTKPQHYNSFYTDKARREFLQKIYRALRSEKDHVFLLSPDIRVLNKIF